MHIVIDRKFLKLFFFLFIVRGSATYQLINTQNYRSPLFRNGSLDP